MVAGSRYQAAELSELGNAIVNVSSASGLASAITSANSNGGRTLLLNPGTTYTLDVTTLPAVTENIRISGAIPVGRDLSEGSVINVTNASHTDDANVFQETEWDHLIFTSADQTANAGLFKGYTSEINYVHDSLFYDFAPSIVYKHADEFRFERNRVLTSGSPPAVVNSNILYVAGSLYVDANEFNFVSNTQNGTGKNIIVGTSGTASTGNTFKEWWITRNRFLDADQANFSTDTIIDIEAGAASTFQRDIRVQNNTLYNGRLDVNSGDNIRINNNEFFYTSNFSGGALGAANSGPPIFLISTGVQNEGDIFVDDNTIAHIGSVPNAVKYQAMVFTIAPNVRSVHIRRNTAILRGGGTDPVAGAIYVSSAGSLSGTISDFIDICDNDVGFTSVPSTVRPMIQVDSGTNGVTHNRIRIMRNRARGTANATEYLPATVNGTVLSTLITIGTGTFLVNNLEIADNHADEVTLSSSTVLLGTSVTLTNRSHVRGNTPELAGATTVIGASPFTYTAGANSEMISILPTSTTVITSIQFTPYGGAAGGYTLTQNAGGTFFLGPKDQLIVTWTTAAPLAKKQPF